MLKKIFLFACFLPVLSSCKNDNKKTADAPAGDVTAVSSFIRAALDGKFSEARRYMLQDSVNNNWMDIAERSYQKADRDTKVGYASSSINIYEISHPDDSTTLVIYSNSFMKKPNILKAVKEDGQWLVDLSYLYIHSMDSTVTKYMHGSTHQEDSAGNKVISKNPASK